MQSVEPKEGAVDVQRLTMLSREIDSRILGAKDAVTYAGRYLGGLLARKEGGQKITGADLRAAREALGHAKRDQEELHLCKEAFPALLAAAREKAQGDNYARALQHQAIAVRAYETAKAEMDRDLRSLSRDDTRAKAIALRTLAQPAKRMADFKTTMEAWDERKFVGLLTELI